MLFTRSSRKGCAANLNSFLCVLECNCFFSSKVGSLADKCRVGSVGSNAECVSLFSSESTQQYRLHRSEKDQNEAQEVSYTAPYITSCP